MGRRLENLASTHLLSINRPSRVPDADLDVESVGELLDAEITTLLLMASRVFSCERSNS